MSRNWKGKVIGSTKTGQDEWEPKTVPLVPEVAEVLRAHRTRMVAEQHPGLKEGWVFPNAKGDLHSGSPLRKILPKALAAAGVERRVTVHGLRHTANDLLRRVASGDVVRAIVGHSTEQMTRHYSHIDESEKADAAAKVMSLVREGVPIGVVSSFSPSDSETPKKQNPRSRGHY